MAQAQAKAPVAKIKYLDEGRKPKIFVEGKPESFEYYTGENNSRIYGQLAKMDNYLIFVGTAQAQKAANSLQLMKAEDMRDTAAMFLELADIVEGKLR